MVGLFHVFSWEYGVCTQLPRESQVCLLFPGLRNCLFCWNSACSKSRQTLQAEDGEQGRPTERTACSVGPAGGPEGSAGSRTGLAGWGHREFRAAVRVLRASGMLWEMEPLGAREYSVSILQGGLLIPQPVWWRREWKQVFKWPNFARSKYAVLKHSAT